MLKVLDKASYSLSRLKQETVVVISQVSASEVNISYELQAEPEI